LQNGIQRRVDPVPLALNRFEADLPLRLLSDQIDRVRLRNDVGLRDNHQRLLHGLLGYLRRDFVFLDHPVKDDVSLLGSSLQVMPWREIIRALQERRQHCCLPDGKLLGRLPEVSLGGCLRPVETTSEIDPVQVQLHDLALRQRPFNPHREKDFKYFPIIRSIPQIEHISSQLLRNRAGPLANTTGLSIFQQSAKHSKKIDPLVLVKPVIFGRDDSIHQVGRDLIQAHLFAVLNEYFSEHLPVPVVNQACRFDRVQFPEIEFRGLLLVFFDEIQPEPVPNSEQNKQDQKRNREPRS
jgi:hypothetical protein